MACMLFADRKALVDAGGDFDELDICTAFIDSQELFNVWSGTFDLWPFPAVFSRMADAGVCTRRIDVVGHCQSPVESAHFDDFTAVRVRGIHWSV